MADIAEAVLNGDMCQGCGCDMDGEGVPQKCRGCSPAPSMDATKSLSIRNAEIKLKKHGLSHHTGNNGVHMIVSTKIGFVDFWPTTGKWRIRVPLKWGYSLNELLKELK